jgi:hypothetical protein
MTNIKPALFGIVTVVLFLGVIAGFQAAGVWSVSGKMDAAGDAVQPAAGDTSSIKGWMTLQQVSDAFGVPVAEILVAFDLSAGTPPTTALRELEGSTFDMIALRAWLQARQGP